MSERCKSAAEAKIEAALNEYAQRAGVQVVGIEIGYLYEYGREYYLVNIQVEGGKTDGQGSKQTA